MCKRRGWREPSGGGHWQGALGAGEGVVSVFSKCSHLQENNISVDVLSQDGKQGK